MQTVICRVTALVALLTSVLSATAQPGATALVDVDALEHAHAVEARNQGLEQAVRALIESAAEDGFATDDLRVEGLAEELADDPRLSASLTFDVSDSALVAPGRYRIGLVNFAVDRFEAALVAAGLTIPSSVGLCGPLDAPGQVDFSISAVIAHDGALVEVGTFEPTYCFWPEGG